MSTHFFKLAAAMALSLLCTVAMAQVPHPLVEQLIRKSGLWAQLDATPERVRMGIRQSTSNALIPEAQRSRMLQLAGQSFAAARIRQALVVSVSNQMQIEQVQQAIAWYESPTGQLITGLEEVSSASGNDSDAALNEGNQALESASPRRQSLIAALIKASRSVHATVDIEIHTSVAVFRGVASSQGRNAGEVVKTFQAALERQRPQLIASTLGQAMVMSALTYATLSDEELEDYLRFLSGDAASHMLDAMYAGIDHVYTQAAQDFGRQILAKGKKPVL